MADHLPYFIYNSSSPIGCSGCSSPQYSFKILWRYLNYSSYLISSPRPLHLSTHSISFILVNWYFTYIYLPNLIVLSFSFLIVNSILLDVRRKESGGLYIRAIWWGTNSLYFPIYFREEFRGIYFSVCIWQCLKIYIYIYPHAMFKLGMANGKVIFSPLTHL